VKTLLLTAASIGLVHTLLGPDHYLPFVMIGWARKWSAARAAVVTALCGLGHVASSVVLGLIGVSVGVAIKRLVQVESLRGDVAAWLLIAFGLGYLVWGIRGLYRKRPHQHQHLHIPGSSHDHLHDHLGEHAHVHDHGQISIAPWTLFIIFVLGPCEPLIPLLMYPAASSGLAGVTAVSVVFGSVTISTMVAAVLLGRWGVDLLPVKRIQKYAHPLAGASILLCGLAIVFLGL